MTASEFAFLALGLVLGVASGAAVVVVLRSRPPGRREVRVTVAPDSVPRRRASTLAEDAFAIAPADPAHGGPADLRATGREETAGAPEAGTAVRSDVAAARPQPPAGAGDSAFVPVAIRVHDEPDWALEALRSTAARTAERAIVDQRLTAAAVLERAAARTTIGTEAGTPTGEGAGDVRGSTPSTHASGERMPDDQRARAAAESTTGTRTGPSAPAEPASPPDPNDPCGGARRVADERCTLATRAKEQAGAAHEALRAAQRSYDDHQKRAEAATAAADPRAMREAKETAQHTFRAARSSARTRDEIEAAAREWLTEINRINHAAREAATTLQGEVAAANGLVLTIERLSVEADAARISAEAADAACLAAREAVADCQEAVQAAVAAAVPRPNLPPAASTGTGPGFHPLEGGDSELEAAFTATGPGEPAILRLLRGDRATLGAIVGQLAGDDEAERRRWQRSLGGLVEAIVGRSIEASALTFPFDHFFWSNFSLGQNRDIVAALASLGYRFDGMGGWTDDRLPSQRDLSLAVGYAGLDPMRLRRWPNETEMQELFTGVAVAADEYLAETAGSLTLGELVDVLGRRADTLTELWNEWGRVRPLLLAGA